VDAPDARLAERLSPYFTAGVLDSDPALVEETYRLRFQVYCHERHFLPAEDYPDGIETDVYDPYSVHLGVLNLQGGIVATARLVERSILGLPMLDHCTVDPPDVIDKYPRHGVVEVSRLSVSRQYRRRAGDGFYGLQGPSPDKVGERRIGGEIVLELYKALYQASKRRGHTHWLMAAEKTLRRLVTKYGFPFVQIGPEADYYGMVAPYSMDLGEFDRVILSGRIPILAEFLNGLEPAYMPVRQDPLPGDAIDDSVRHAD
jgi:N-acyl amino acid synthase of PEP-CTERM/exosortase system